MGYEPSIIHSKEKVIIKVDNGIGKSAGIEVGDILLAIDDKPVIDVFDYRFLIQNKKIKVTVKKSSDEIKEYNITKGEYDDLDIYFEEGLMDDAKSCKNKCIFCFIDQLPKGMRETLYFKDDDSRLSFLQGNYVTLTNMKEEELDRILYYKLSPINVSVHCTDPEVRTFMLKNPNSAKIMDYLGKIADANIQMNFQIVLCKGVNDKEHLVKSIKDLAKFIPNGQSLSVVPFGMSKYRDDLPTIEMFNKQDAIEIIDVVEKMQKQFLKENGTRFVFLADEFYLLAERELPKNSTYEDFPQIENGVGYMSNFRHESIDALDKYFKYNIVNKKVGIITGSASYNFMCDIVQKVNEVYKVNATVIKVENEFFGRTITVSGLMVGQDIINKINKTSKDYDEILIPDNCLRDGEETLLDDLTVTDIQKQTGIKITPVAVDGYDFVTALLEENE